MARQRRLFVNIRRGRVRQRGGAEASLRASRASGGREGGDIMATHLKLVEDLPGGEKRPLLTVARILGWAVAHHAATGQWPSRGAGRVRETLFFETWHAIDAALARGTRGLQGGQTLERLLREHLGLEPGMSAEEARGR